MRRYDTLPPGTVDWLIGTEAKYGGLVSGVTALLSTVDDSARSVRRQLNKGGDRMLHHGYAEKYAEYLEPFVAAQRPITLVEIGVLKGTGLATWCDLFTDSTIIGLDIDLSNFENNKQNMTALGAFSANTPNVHKFDQFVDNQNHIKNILDGDSIDICIDDGFHSTESIISTLRSVLPSLSKSFVYFVEDNATAHSEISKEFPSLDLDVVGEFTIITPA